MKNAGSNPIKANDPEVLEKLIYMYSDALVRYAYSYVRNAAAAEDFMEDAFASLYIKKQSFASYEQMRAWLYKCVHGKAVDYIRRKKPIPLEDVEHVLSGGDMESAFLSKERNALIFRCIQQLPQQYRDVLQLSYFDEFSVNDICAILRKSPKQVYNLLSRARVALKQILIKEGYSHEDL